MPWAKSASLLIATLSWCDVLLGRIPSWPEMLAFAAFFAAMAWGSLDLRAQAFVSARWRGAPETDAVALTFDDGPDSVGTKRVLASLRRHGARATFFLLGSKVDKAPDIARSIVAQGHEVGCHGHTHTWTSFVAGPRTRRVLTRACHSIEQATGVRPRYFRPPYGVSLPGTAGGLRAMDLSVIGWSLRSLDTRRGVTDIEARAAELVERVAPGDIVLLHDAPHAEGLPLPLGPDLVEPLLQGLARRGLRAVTISELLGS